MILIALAASLACGGPKTQAGPGSNSQAAKQNTPTEPIRDPRTPVDVTQRSLQGLTFEVFRGGKKIEPPQSDADEVFMLKYQGIPGVLTFRGGPLRDSPSYGVAKVREKKLKKIWQFGTGTSRGRWGGGAGWTGQPSIVTWPGKVRGLMNLKEPYKSTNGFTEVIQASLSGQVYFIDLKTGKATRNPISIGNPIKGSVAVHPYGVPMLYVGDGINETGKVGFRLFSLIDQKMLHFFTTQDPIAPRRWPGNDCSALFNAANDTLVVGSENGLIHRIDLGTKWDPATGKLSVNPTDTKLKFKTKYTREQGTENSIAVYKNLAYFANNGGDLVCLDLMTMRPVWNRDITDDTDATVVIDVESEGKWGVYTGCEVDKQGAKGFCYVRKFDGLTGKLAWANKYKCFTIYGEHPVNGGLLATPIVGKKKASDRVVFSLARWGTMNGGLLVALDKKTGKEIWRRKLPNYAWSSPVDFYDAEGNMYIVQCTSAGEMKLIDGASGEILDELNFGSNIEASPAIYENTIVVAARGTIVYGVRIL